MTQYSSEHFSEPIRRMTDGALLRIQAMQSGEVESMRDGDQYYSDYSRQETTAYIETSVTTTTRAFIHDQLPDATVQQDVLTDGPFAGMLGGILLTLTDAHDLAQGRAISPLSYDAQDAAKRLQEAWLLSSTARHEHTAFRLYTTELGSTALGSILLTFDAARQQWQLGIEHLGPNRLYVASNPNYGDIEIVEYVEDLADAAS